MQVTIVFHHEPIESGRLVWWAESPDVRGFYATREHFAETMQVAEAALREALRDQGVDPHSIQFSHAFAEVEEARPA